MISRKELERVAKSTNLNPYQQEKDYLLKLFLYNYYSRFENAVFKGGTCIKYLYGIDRFSEDLDFNLLVSPSKFENEVKKTLNTIKSLGIENYLIKDELFKQAFTCEIAFNGPLYSTTKQTRNKFRIDAGTRTGLIKKPKWQLVTSEYLSTVYEVESFVLGLTNTYIPAVTAESTSIPNRSIIYFFFLDITTCIVFYLGRLDIFSIYQSIYRNTVPI